MTYKLAPSRVKNLEMISLFLSVFLCVILPKRTRALLYMKEELIDRVLWLVSA